MSFEDSANANSSPDDVMDESNEGVPVLAGRTSEGLDWIVTAGGDDEWFMTMLSVSRDGEQIGEAGMGGPRLYPGSLMSNYEGQFPELPYFVVVRVDPSIDRVIATTDEGSEIVLALSTPNPQFQLRFGVAAMPDGETPGSLRAESERKIVERTEERFSERRDIRQAVHRDGVLHRRHPPSVHDAE